MATFYAVFNHAHQNHATVFSTSFFASRESPTQAPISPNRARQVFSNRDCIMATLCSRNARPRTLVRLVQNMRGSISQRFIRWRITVQRMPIGDLHPQLAALVRPRVCVGAAWLRRFSVWERKDLVQANREEFEQWRCASPLRDKRLLFQPHL